MKREKRKSLLLIFLIVPIFILLSNYTWAQGRWSPGDTHIHTEHSDWDMAYIRHPLTSPPTVEEQARAANDTYNLEWVIITDHEETVPGSMNAQEWLDLREECVQAENTVGIRVLCGEEVGFCTHDQRGHYLAYNINGFIQWPTTNTAQQMINEVNNSNGGQGLGFIAHPDGGLLRWRDWNVINYIGMAIMSEGIIPINANTLDRWIQYLNLGRGNHNIGIGESDAHWDGRFADEPHPGSSITFCYVEGALTHNAIYNALRGGQVVFSNGPLVYFTIGENIIGDMINLSEEGVFITSDPPKVELTLDITWDSRDLNTIIQTIEIHTNRGLNNTIGAGGRIGNREETIEIPIDVTYVRLRAIFTNNREAYTNPIWISPRLDIIFTIDVTGSMWDDIDAVKASATNIVDEISKNVPDWRVAVVSFQDFPVNPYGCEPDDLWPGYPGDWPYLAVLPFSTDKTSVINAINGLEAFCGWDWPESIYSALIRSIYTESLGTWRDNVKKVIILMTDSYPHDPEPFTNYTGGDVKNAAESVDPAVIYPVLIGWDSIAKAYAEKIAGDTGGKVFLAPTVDDVVDAILEAIEVALQSPVAEANGPYSGTVSSLITFDASGSYDPDGEIVSYEWDFNNDGIYDTLVTTSTTTYTYGAEYSGLAKLRVTDNDGLTYIDTALVEIIGNNPPTANAGPDQTVAVDSTCIASIILDGSGSSDPDGDPLTYTWTWDGSSANGINPTIQLSLGTTTITLVVNDGTLDSDPDTVDINVIDETPPEISLTVSSDTLWPPNHKMVLITPTITVTDNCDPDPIVELTSITTNEGDETNTYHPDYDTTIGDGNTTNDIQVDENGNIYLRAERSGKGNGRIYTITYTATDASGNSSTASATVTVPHDQE